MDNMKDEHHTMEELYEHRCKLFLALMYMCASSGFEAGWSRRHSDGELCFGSSDWCIGWIVVGNGKEIRYHFPSNLAPDAILEHEFGKCWNGVDDTLDALESIYSLRFG